jgi:DNA-directed RNA polymerase specialized sigma24 family protein
MAFHGHAKQTPQVFHKTSKTAPRNRTHTIHTQLEQTPDAQETEIWNLAYQKRLFQWAANEVKSEFSEKTWDAFWNTAVKNQNSQETAKALSMSLGAVYIAKSRVISRIRQQIESISGQEDTELWSRSGDSFSSSQ